MSTPRILFIAVASFVVFPVAHGMAQPAQEEASRRFEQGLALFEEGRYDAALAEFTEAHRVAPTVITLFNIGRVHAMLGHAVEAADTYERALREYASDLDDETRAQIQTELRGQEARVGRLDIRVNVGRTGRVTPATSSRTYSCTTSAPARLPVLVTRTLTCWRGSPCGSAPRR